MPWRPDYLTLAEAKGFLRLNDTLDDAEIQVYLSAASRAVDHHCNRQFGKSDGVQTRLYTAWYDTERCRWIADIDDVQEPVGLVVTVGGVVTTDYLKEPVNAPEDDMPWTELSFARSAAVCPTGAEYEVSVTANPFGWLEIPKPARMATRLQLNRFATRREAPFGVAGSTDSQIRLLSKLDPDVAISLLGLVRPRKVG